MDMMCVGGKIVFAERGVENHEIISTGDCATLYPYTNENLTPAVVCRWLRNAHHHKHQQQQEKLTTLLLMLTAGWCECVSIYYTTLQVHICIYIHIDVYIFTQSTLLFDLLTKSKIYHFVASCFLPIKWFFRKYFFFWAHPIMSCLRGEVDYKNTQI